MTPDYIGKCVACALNWASETKGAYGRKSAEPVETFVNRGLRMMMKTIDEDSGYPLDPALVEPLNAVVGSVIRGHLEK